MYCGIIVLSVLYKHKEVNHMNFSDNLKKYREKAGFTSAREFAAILNIPYTTYAAYENDRRQPKYETLIEIARKLNISTDELLGYEINEFERCKLIAERAGFSITIKGNEIYVNGVMFKKPKFIHSINKSVEQVSIITNHMQQYMFRQDYINRLESLVSERISFYLLKPKDDFDMTPFRETENILQDLKNLREKFNNAYNDNSNK